jgi:hypothetical protein
VTLARPKPRRCCWPRFAHHHWPTKVFGRPLSQRWMRPNQNVQAGGAPPRGSLLTGLDGAAGSRSIESIHVVDRSASRLPDAMSP